MFSQACVKNSVHRGGVYPSMHWGRHRPGQTPPPRADTPPWADIPLPRQTPPPWADIPLLPSACWDTHTPCPVHAGIHPLPSVCWDKPPPRPLQRTVRILLKCILVCHIFTFSLTDKIREHMELSIMSAFHTHRYSGLPPECATCGS